MASLSGKYAFRYPYRLRFTSLLPCTNAFSSISGKKSTYSLTLDSSDKILPSSEDKLNIIIPDKPYSVICNSPDCFHSVLPSSNHAEHATRTPFTASVFSSVITAHKAGLCGSCFTPSFSASLAPSAQPPSDGYDRPPHASITFLAIISVLH